MPEDGSCAVRSSKGAAPRKPSRPSTGTATRRCSSRGFFDLLSHLTLQHEPEPAVDTAVLNSVVNLPRALPFLARHATIHTFLDNDEAGYLTLERLRSALPGATVIDRAESYRAHKDLNESLRPAAKISRTPRRRARKL